MVLLYKWSCSNSAQSVLFPGAVLTELIIVFTRGTAVVERGSGVETSKFKLHV